MSSSSSPSVRAFVSRLCSCPHCGGVLVIQGATLALAVADDRGDVRGTSPVLSCTSTSTSTRTAAPLEQGALPLPPALAKPPTTTTWKRAIAIAHRAIDDCGGDGAAATERFKELCSEQQIPYGELGGDGRPLFARALDYAIGQRRRRTGSR